MLAGRWSCFLVGQLSYTGRLLYAGSEADNDDVVSMFERWCNSGEAWVLYVCATHDSDSRIKRLVQRSLYGLRSSWTIRYQNTQTRYGGDTICWAFSTKFACFSFIRRGKLGRLDDHSVENQRTIKLACPHLLRPLTQLAPFCGWLVVSIRYTAIQQSPRLGSTWIVQLLLDNNWYNLTFSANPPCCTPQDYPAKWGSVHRAPSAI